MAISADHLSDSEAVTVPSWGREDEKRRQELRAFLMSRRARLRPSDVGLPDTARRRTPGLRREEVAQLAGLSTEWYTAFEMAKDTGVSRKTIDAIASALKLTPAEHKHLTQLATGEIAPVRRSDVVDPVLRMVLDGYLTGPAMLLNVRMDVVAANAIAVAIFGDLSSNTDFERNWLWYLYQNHALFNEWESQARELTATFRGSMCEFANDPGYTSLMNTLLATNETFKRFWNDHDVADLDSVPPLAMNHPVYGPLRFTMRVLAQPGATNPFYVCFLVPDEATSASDAFKKLRSA